MSYSVIDGLVVLYTPCPEKRGHNIICITSTNVDTVS